MQAVNADRHHEPMEWLEPIYREHSRAVIQAAYRVTGNAEAWARGEPVPATR